MQGPDRIRLASYNMRKGIGLDRRRRPERILDVINALDADVIALQEADRRLGARPAVLDRRAIEENTDFRALDTGLEGPSLGWHGNAILVRKGLDAGPVQRLDLPGTEPRGALLAPVSGLYVLGAHLGLLRRDRRRQLERIAALLAGLEGAQVVLGDFNEWSPNRGLEALRGFRLLAPGYSYHAARPVAALDRFALAGGAGFADAGVADTPLSRIASDHLPVWADITLPGTPTPARQDRHRAGSATGRDVIEEP